MMIDESKIKNNEFSNPDYQPKDFSALRNSDLGKLLDDSRLVDKVCKLLGVSRLAVPEQMKTMTQELKAKKLILEIVRSGFAGMILETGNIVDRREYPEAIPLQKNSLLNIPEPKAIDEELQTIFDEK